MGAVHVSGDDSRLLDVLVSVWRRLLHRRAIRLTARAAPLFMKEDAGSLMVNFVQGSGMMVSSSWLLARIAAFRSEVSPGTYPLGDLFIEVMPPCGRPRRLRLSEAEDLAAFGAPGSGSMGGAQI